MNVEQTRIEKEISRISTSLDAVKKKLSNQGFASKTPVEVIERKKMKMNDWEKLKAILADLN